MQGTKREDARTFDRHGQGTAVARSAVDSTTRTLAAHCHRVRRRARAQRQPSARWLTCVETSRAAAALAADSAARMSLPAASAAAMAPTNSSPAPCVLSTTTRMPGSENAAPRPVRIGHAVAAGRHHGGRAERQQRKRGLFRTLERVDDGQGGQKLGLDGVDDQYVDQGQASPARGRGPARR